MVDTGESSWARAPEVLRATPVVLRVLVGGDTPMTAQ
jgi:hypothetical protein